MPKGKGKGAEAPVEEEEVVEEVSDGEGDDDGNKARRVAPKVRKSGALFVCLTCPSCALEKCVRTLPPVSVCVCLVSLPFGASCPCA